MQLIEPSLILNIFDFMFLSKKKTFFRDDQCSANKTEKTFYFSKFKLLCLAEENSYFNTKLTSAER